MEKLPSIARHPMLDPMPKPPFSSIHYFFHFGTEFLQVAEIVKRLTYASQIANRKTVPLPPAGYPGEKFHEALRAALDGLRTPEELVANLTSDEISELLKEWEKEMQTLGKIVWDRYADSMGMRTKRRWARRLMADDPEPRILARKSNAAKAMGLAGAGSIDALLNAKKAQGGIYDMDPRLLKDPAADEEKILGYLVPPIPVSKASRKKR